MIFSKAGKLCKANLLSRWLFSIFFGALHSATETHRRNLHRHVLSARKRKPFLLVAPIFPTFPKMDSPAVCLDQRRRQRQRRLAGDDLVDVGDDGVDERHLGVHGEGVEGGHGQRRHGRRGRAVAAGHRDGAVVGGSGGRGAAAVHAGDDAADRARQRGQRSCEDLLRRS